MASDITWINVPWSRYSSHFGPELPSAALPGWVVEHDGTLLQVVTPSGPMTAEISGRLRHLVELGESEAPAVGDFVAIRGVETGQVEQVFPRRTTFRRKEAGRRVEAQVICANADIAMIVTTAPATDDTDGHDLDEFSLRRVERYIATLDSRIQPVVVLNKCDLVADPQAVRSYVAAELPGTTVVAISALTGDGVGFLEQLIEPGRVAVTVGSSGCGKSTLIARLAGAEITTRAIRGTDGRGRHTTTARRIYLLPAGGLLVDTPGMREVQLWADDDTADDPVAEAFPEIARLEGTCRFSDCRHEHEPGCAIKSALETGDILADRYHSYLRLRDETECTAEMRRQRARQWGKQIAKFSRQLKKERGR